MADQRLHAPTNPHFFKPLLPGFHTHLDIPIAFFLKHVKGRNEHNKTATLRSDASDETWIVKKDGLKFTDGWGDFANAHDLRVGDFVVFRHEGEMVFHVTALGPSCCEIQYTSSSSHNDIIDDDQTNNSENSSRKKRVKRNPRKIGECSSDHSSFVAHVSASSLTNDQMYLPRSFVRSNGLNKRRGKKIVLVNEEGRSWILDLKNDKAGTHTYLRSGWKSFCAANGMNQGTHYTFKLVSQSGPLVIRLCRAEDYTPKPDSKSEPEPKPKPEPEPEFENSFFKGSATLSSLKHNSLYLPKKFVTANGLNKRCREVVLKNESGERWSLALKHFESHGLTFLKRGWTSFCQVNKIKAGDSFMFKLVGTGKTPILSLCPAQSKTPLDSNPSIEDKNVSQSQERFEIEKRKYTQKQFVTLTLTPKALEYYKLILPKRFTRVNGINKPGKITLLGRDRVKRVVDLRLHDKRSKIMRIGKGWREFCEAEEVKIGESFVLELIWEDNASPVLKFHSRLNSI